MATQLSTLDEVKLVLRFTDRDTNRDSQLQAALDGEQAWFLNRARGTFVTSGNATARFYDVTADALLELPLPDATVTAVRAGWPGFELRTLDSSEYVVQDKSRLRLRTGFFWPYSYYENQWSRGGASTSNLLGVIEVDYTTPTDLNTAITRGLALLAAGAWLKSNPNINVMQERIGDYEYRTAALAKGASQSEIADQIRAEGMRMLRPWLGRRVLVT